jgi:hypothetical protein
MEVCNEAAASKHQMSMIHKGVGQGGKKEGGRESERRRWREGRKEGGREKKRWREGGKEVERGRRT